MRRHCTVTSWLRQAEHVGDDLLGLASGAGCCDCTKTCPPSSTQRQRGVGLEVEVLLAAELELAARRRGRALASAASGVAAAQRGPARPGSSRPRSPRATVTSDGQRLVVDLDAPRRRAGRPRGSRRAPSRRRGRGTSPRSGNSGSSCLTPASLTPGTSSAVSTRTTPGTSSAGAVSQRGHPGVGVRRLHRLGVQHAAGAG